MERCRERSSRIETAQSATHAILKNSQPGSGVKFREVGSVAFGKAAPTESRANLLSASSSQPAPGANGPNDTRSQPINTNKRIARDFGWMRGATKTVHHSRSERRKWATRSWGLGSQFRSDLQPRLRCAKRTFTLGDKIGGLGTAFREANVAFGTPYRRCWEHHTTNEAAGQKSRETPLGICGMASSASIAFSRSTASTANKIPAAENPTADANDTLSAAVALSNSNASPANTIAGTNPQSADQNNNANDTLSAGPSDCTAPNAKIIAAEAPAITTPGNGLNDTLSAVPCDSTESTGQAIGARNRSR